MNEYGMLQLVMFATSFKDVDSHGKLYNWQLFAASTLEQGDAPQHRGAHLSPSFNDLVQMDVFQFQDHLFMLVIDEATRYKVATSCPGRYLKDHFGPMKVFVTDQEFALMTIEAGEEFQRVGIERRPAGTTTKKQGQMHTTTGLVERHIDLVKMSMLKIQAESGRYGIGVEMEELAAEAAMSQNLTMSVGGYTPPIPPPCYSLGFSHVVSLNLMLNIHMETSLQKAALNDHYD